MSTVFKNIFVSLYGQTDVTDAIDPLQMLFIYFSYLIYHCNGVLFDCVLDTIRDNSQSLNFVSEMCGIIGKHPM